MNNKKNNVGCLGIFLNWFLHFILGTVIVLIGIAFLTSKGIFSSSLWTNIQNDLKISKLINQSNQITSTFKNLTNNTDSSTTNNSSSSTSSEGSNNSNNTQFTYEPLKFLSEKQLELGEYDNLGRATYAHIQLKNSDEPKSNSRDSYITYNPVGWHNYKLNYSDSKTGETKQSWLFNRGHLIGYQFSGLNSEGKNLVIETRYLNSGSISDKAMDASNPYAMLFYENKLDKWLSDNPSNYLDYMVVPNYINDELIPRTVTLYWTGFDNNGNQVSVNLSDNGIATLTGKVSSVTLDNSSENANIDYLNGTATQK